MTTPQTGAEALARALAILRAAGVETPERDARVLLAHAMDLPRDRLTLVLRDPLAAGVAPRFEALIAARAARRPVSHLVGGRLFHDRWFRVTPDVLDPRPETEALVRQALSGPFRSVLDLGTGSGAILLTLLAERPGTTGTGTDISGAALAVAQRNAGALGLSGCASFLVSDWYAAPLGRFDLIVSNPPYIAANEMAGLAPEVRLHEPAWALTDGADGLTAYRAIAAGARAHLAAGGRICLEIGPTQAGAVTGILAAAGLADVTVHPDMDRRDRVVSARNPG